MRCSLMVQEERSELSKRRLSRENASLEADGTEHVFMAIWVIWCIWFLVVRFENSKILAVRDAEEIYATGTIDSLHLKITATQLRHNAVKSVSFA